MNVCIVIDIYCTEVQLTNPSRTITSHQEANLEITEATYLERFIMGLEYTTFFITKKILYKSVQEVFLKTNIFFLDFSKVNPKKYFAQNWELCEPRNYSKIRQTLVLGPVLQY